MVEQLRGMEVFAGTHNIFSSPDLSSTKGNPCTNTFLCVTIVQ